MSSNLAPLDQNRNIATSHQLLCVHVVIDSALSALMGRRSEGHMYCHTLTVQYTTVCMSNKTAYVTRRTSSSVTSERIGTVFESYKISLQFPTKAQLE